MKCLIDGMPCTNECEVCKVREIEYEFRKSFEGKCLFLIKNRCTHPFGKKNNCDKCSHKLIL